MNVNLQLAPIRGITDQIFCSLFQKHFGGFDGAQAPFIAVAKHTGKANQLPKAVNPALDAVPTVPQILSNHSAEFLSLANVLYDLGYVQVNWNLGCPHPVVTSKAKGSGLLPYPERIDEFLAQVIPKLKGKLSIKMRLGYKTADEIFELLPIMNKYPLTELIIHARTGKQMYSGVPDLNAFGRCVLLSKHPLVYNGDINSLEDWQVLQKRYNAVSKWMIGRGALRNPFLPAEIKGKNIKTAEQKLQILKAFHADLYAANADKLSGPAHLLDKMTAYWEYACDFFPAKQKIFKKIKKIKQLPIYQELVQDLFKV